MNFDTRELIKNIAFSAKQSSLALSAIDTRLKDQALLLIAEKIVSQKGVIKSQNELDVEGAKSKGLSDALVDRLILSDKRINSMVEGLRQIASLNDPVGEIIKTWKRPNGLVVGQMRIPLGVIGIIYESRPSVTVDAAALCLKAGNSVILRGGSESINSNLAIGQVINEALDEVGIPVGCVQIVPIMDRNAILDMLKLDELIDLIIPRGGEGLIRFVSENSKIPVLKHYKGVCHVFVDESADVELAIRIAVNSKVQRPGVCNAMETLLVHKNIAKGFLPLVARELIKHDVEIKGCDETRKIIKEIIPAEEKNYYEEYLDLILNVKVVESMEDAIIHIHKYGSMHTDSIVTESYKNSQYFLSRVNSSAVIVNASTRFNDGFELGLGAEIGISTSKLHAFGPMGVEELTSRKFVVYGEGQVRE